MRFRIDKIISEEINRQLFISEVERMKEECDKFLSRLGLYLYIDYDYDWDLHDDRDHILACYEAFSVFEGCIDVAINYEAYMENAKRLKLNEDEVLRDIKVCVWHEIGHGILELLWDYYANGAFDKLDRNKYRNLAELLSRIGGDEEELVEDFGR